MSTLIDMWTRCFRNIEEEVSLLFPFLSALLRSWYILGIVELSPYGLIVKEKCFFNRRQGGIEYNGKALIDALKKKMKGKNNIKVMEEIVEDYLFEV